MCAKLEQNSTFVYGIVVQFGFSIFVVSGDAGVRLVREFPLIVSVLMSEGTAKPHARPKDRTRCHSDCAAAAMPRFSRAPLKTSAWAFDRHAVALHPDAERIYARCGWRTVETIPRKGRTYALMRRDLIA
jgi:hypothetical protein